MKPGDLPAFPTVTTHEGGGDLYCPGLSLRMYFAGQALVGLLAFSRGEDCVQYGPDEAADAAVRYADALIARLAKG